MIEVVVTTGAIRCAKLQSNRYHQQTNTQFVTGQMPSCHPTNNVRHSIEGKQQIPTITMIPVTVTICGDACPLSCVSAEAYKLAQCTRPQGWGS